MVAARRLGSPGAGRGPAGDERHGPRPAPSTTTARRVDGPSTRTTPWRPGYRIWFVDAHPGRCSYSRHRRLLPSCATRPISESPERCASFSCAPISSLGPSSSWWSSPLGPHPHLGVGYRRSSASRLHLARARPDVADAGGGRTAGSPVTPPQAWPAEPDRVERGRVPGLVGVDVTSWTSASRPLGRCAVTERPAAQRGALDCRWLIGHVEGADIGSGRHDLVDLVEDLIVEGEVGAGE